MENYAEAIAGIVRAESAHADAIEEFLTASRRLQTTKDAVVAARARGRAVVDARIAELDEAIQ